MEKTEWSLCICGKCVNFKSVKPSSSLKLLSVFALWLHLKQTNSHSVLKAPNEMARRFRSRHAFLVEKII